MRLVAVTVKKNRLSSPHKYQGGVLNPDAVHGHGYYVRRMVGHDAAQIQAKLKTIITSQQIK